MYCQNHLKLSDFENIKMNISEIEKLSFQLLTKAFFYLWPFHVKWSKAFTQIELTKPNKKIIPFYFSISLFFLFGAMACVTSAVISRLPNITRIQCAVQMLIGTGILAITTVTFHCFLDFSDILSAFSQFLILARRLEKGQKTLT